MESLAFEELAERMFHQVPEQFRSAIENVRIVVEDYPSDELVATMHLPSRHALLGLYQGVARPHRGTWYGSYPVMPDTITLYQKNIESISHDESSLAHNVFTTLVHELGHYFGMTEEEIRALGY